MQVSRGWLPAWFALVVAIGYPTSGRTADEPPVAGETRTEEEEATEEAAEKAAEEAAEKAAEEERARLEAEEEAAEQAEREARNRAEMEDPFRPRYLVEALEVHGNAKTRGDLILSYVNVKPGEVLDEEIVELSRIRLLALGYFKDVRTRLERGSKRGRVKLIFEVEERNTIIIDDLFLGFSETNPFWGGLGISDINFLGLGMVLSGAFVASEDQQAARLGVFWPSVLSTRLQAGVQAIFANGRERALLSKLQDAGGEQPGNCVFTTDQDLPYLRAGAILSAGMRLDRSHRVLFELHTEHIQANATEPLLGGEPCGNYPFQGYIRDGQSTLSSFSFQFERDTRDDFFLPTQGMRLVITIELASKVVGSDYEFSKYTVQYDHSFSLWLDHVLRLKVQGGLIQDVGERGSPFFSRFFVGDYAAFLIQKDSLPRNLEVNFSEAVDYGDLLASVSAEYDVPLWSSGIFFTRGYLYATLNFSYLTKASFLASEDEWSGRTKRPVSFDLGLKFDTPIGLFTLSLGYMMDLVF